MKTFPVLLGLAVPVPLQAALVDMWNFNSISGGPIANGTTTAGVNGGIATVRGAGAVSVDAGAGFWGVNLPGGSSASAAYIDLPNGIVSGLTDATFETWVQVDSVTNWARVFDFGSNTNGEQTGPGGAGNGNDYFTLTAFRGSDINTQRFEFINDGVGRGTVDNGANLTLGVKHHIVMTFDDLAPDFSIAVWYLDGVPMGGGVMSANLADLNDVNNWLGRSQWGGDANTDGTYDQFAIYNTAWSPAEVQASFAAGPIPEPSSALMFGGAALGLLARRRRS